MRIVASGVVHGTETSNACLCVTPPSLEQAFLEYAQPHPQLVTLQEQLDAVSEQLEDLQQKR